MTPVSHKPQGNLIEINNVIVVMWDILFYSIIHYFIV
jgi:hypothetical protein